MKRAFILSLFLLVLTAASAQTQQGVVKTKGRMVNGQLQPGTKLSGAVIAVRGRSAVLSQSNGKFSFPTNGQSFMLDSVRKKGYQMVDAEFFKRTYRYSANPLFIVMEPPEQQQADQLEAQRKIRRTLQRQLQQREDEIETMQVSLAEKQALLDQLYKNQENNEQLISEMAKRYAELDYDQMDELNGRISECILNGELVKADSLLRTKGDIHERLEELKRHQNANTQVRQDLEKSEALAQRKLVDLATDCYSRFEICGMESRFDSAAHYITMRAELDTTNLRYQIDAGRFLRHQRQHSKAKIYIFRAYRCRIDHRADIADLINAYDLMAQYLSDEGKHDMSAKIYKIMIDSYINTYSIAFEKYVSGETNAILNAPVAMLEKEIALECMYNGDYEESEKYFKAALEKLERMTKDVPGSYRSELYITNIDLAELYRRMKRYDESEAIYKISLDTARQRAITDPKGYDNTIACIQHGLGKIFMSTNRLPESELALQEALDIYTRYADNNPQAYSIQVAYVKRALALLYYKQNRDGECIRMSESAYNIFVDNSLSINDAAVVASNLAQLYSKHKKYDEYLKWSHNSLAAYQYLLEVKNDTSVVKKIAIRQGNLSWYSLLVKNYADAEKYARIGLATDSTLHWIATNLAHALLFQGRLEEAKVIYRQYKEERKATFLDDFKQLEEAGAIPKEREADVERIKKILNE